MAKISYGGMITREQFCFFETRAVARLICEGKTEKEVIEEVVADNLFQYPTERSLVSISKACYKRMMSLNDMDLVNVVAYQPMETAKQVCLYAMMKTYPVVWDFMTQVVGEKFRVFNMNFGMIDMNEFFMRLQDSNDEVAGWSDATIEKIKQVLRKILVENEYLDDVKADHLNSVYLESKLEECIRANGDDDALPAFNCLY